MHLPASACDCDCLELSLWDKDRLGLMTKTE
jgi:hypothetical protein